MAICEMRECTGCEACAQACPVNSISMIPDGEGFRYPRIDETRCIKCGKCQRVCPNNISISKAPSTFYMGWHLDEDVLKNSSSGGAYTAFADCICQAGGVVFGAYFDENTREVYHIAIENKNDLYRTRLSKYYQGTNNDAYRKAKEYLESGRCVLYSGTACQIAGLYGYLGKSYDKLVTVDVLCHGVPSKAVIDRYIDAKEKRYRKKIKSYRFRLKPDDSAWQNGGGTRIRIDFEDGTRVIEDNATDTFFLAFNEYLFLRESCYACRYTGTERVSDITIADYWGVTEQEVGKDPMNNGVSLILTNTKKGAALLEEAQNAMHIQPIDGEKAIASNLALIKPGTRNAHRAHFFAHYKETDFDRLIHRYYKMIYFKKGIRNLLGDRVYDAIKHGLGK